jgi:hypothetical protein
MFLEVVMSTFSLVEEFALMGADVSDVELDLAELELAYALEAGCSCPACEALRRSGLASGALLDFA